MTEEFDSIRFYSDDVEHELPCHRIAKFPDDTIAILEVAGPQMQVRALHGCLNTKGYLKVQHSEGYPFARLAQYAGFYYSWWNKLPHGCLHLVVMAKQEGLLPEISQRGLWREFMSDRYTTPLMFGWVPWIGKRLIAEDLLVTLEARHCKPGVLKCGTHELDELAEEGVQCEVLEIPEAEVN